MLTCLLTTCPIPQPMSREMLCYIFFAFSSKISLSLVFNRIEKRPNKHVIWKDSKEFTAKPERRVQKTNWSQPSRHSIINISSFKHNNEQQPKKKHKKKISKPTCLLEVTRLTIPQIPFVSTAVKTLPKLVIQSKEKKNLTQLCRCLISKSLRIPSYSHSNLSWIVF